MPAIETTWHALRLSLLACCCMLAGCTGYRTWRNAPTSHGPSDMAQHSEMMQRILGHPPDDTPLAPEPGDIWADVLPSSATSGATLTTATPQTTPPPTTTSPTTTSPTAASPTVTSPSATASGTQVQLAAAPSEQQAHAAWRRLRQQSPKLIGDHTPSVSAARNNGHEIWRLRTGGFANVAEARAFCSDIRAVSGECWVVPAGVTR